MLKLIAVESVNHAVRICDMLLMVYTIAHYDEVIQKCIDVLAQEYGSIQYVQDMDVMEVHGDIDNKDGAK